MKTNKIKVKKHGKEYEIELEVEARNVILDDDHQFISKDKLEELEKKPGTDDPVTNNTVVFTQAATRTNINSGETLAVMFGKIKKFFADLKAVAFSGNYSDLTGVPTLGTAAAKGVSNSLTVTQDGYVLDARAGKTVNDKFGGLRFYEDASGKYVVGADSVPKKLGSGINQKFTQINNIHTIRTRIVRSEGNKTKTMSDMVFNIKAVCPDYASFTTDNFYFCITKSKVDHYSAENFNIWNLGEFAVEKIYDPVSGTLQVNNVAGRSAETPDSRLSYDIVEFELIIV